MTPMLLPGLLAYAGAGSFALVLNGSRKRFKQASADRSVNLEYPRTVLVSLIIPARDAAATLGFLLEDLRAQVYPDALMEVLVVDDGSSDGTAEIVHRMGQGWPQLRLLTSADPGKKAAISLGVKEAKGEWIILTDADARCGVLRVQRIMGEVQRADPDLLLLPVATLSAGGMLQGTQEMEQMALLGMAAGLALSGKPALANGANMAFSRTAFLKVRGYEGDRFASGDDIFLLHRMKRARMHVRYLIDPEVIVTVQAETDLHAFWRQRLRWAGKMRGARGAGNGITFVALILPWLLLWFTIITGSSLLSGQRPLGYAFLLIIPWLLWIIPVIGLVREVRHFLNSSSALSPQRDAPLLTALAFVAFSIYAPNVAIVSFFVRPTWKGRKI